MRLASLPSHNLPPCAIHRAACSSFSLPSKPSPLSCSCLRAVRSLIPLDLALFFPRDLTSRRTMKLLGVATLALSASVVSAWSVEEVLDSLGLGGLWPWHPHHPKHDPTPAPTPLAPTTGGDNWAVLVAGSNGWFNYRHQVLLSFHAFSAIMRMLRSGSQYLARLRDGAREVAPADD